MRLCSSVGRAILSGNANVTSSNLIQNLESFFRRNPDFFVLLHHWRSFRYQISTGIEHPRSLLVGPSALAECGWGIKNTAECGILDHLRIESNRCGKARKSLSVNGMEISKSLDASHLYNSSLSFTLTFFSSQTLVYFLSRKLSWYFILGTIRRAPSLDQTLFIF